VFQIANLPSGCSTGYAPILSSFLSLGGGYSFKVGLDRLRHRSDREPFGGFDQCPAPDRNKAAVPCEEKLTARHVKKASRLINQPDVNRANPKFRQFRNQGSAQRDNFLDLPQVNICVRTPPGLVSELRVIFQLSALRVVLLRAWIACADHTLPSHRIIKFSIVSTHTYSLIPSFVIDLFLSIGPSGTPNRPQSWIGNT
jgi:hypothetical protein